ncbi:TPR domain-containing glycosyltransferase [Paenibacillus sp. YYML68]|uniref:glycosyltransferase n=1 Tax=Paenibacillus sp. YYML68 TaxID=2909250 RepID=UPI002491DEB7|nr:TPR domain-containing glycosyltransferase [Paenibacillus sp. YYML68]
MSKPLISLCMIVKNEANCIARCLTSVKPYVDEMIIVDTGSTDGTADICRDIGATVYDYVWNDHFAEARNYGLVHANGEWILWLDADEELGENGEQLRDLALSDEYDLYSFQLNNYYGPRVDPNNVIRIAHPRLFRNGIGLKFRNQIHEALNVDEIFYQHDRVHRITHTPVILWHYGYLDEFVQDKNKSKRNIQLLEKALSSNKEDPWLHYHMASEYYRLKDYAPSFHHANRSILLFMLNQLTPPSLLYKLKYSILISTGSYEGGYPAIEKAIMLYPDYVDLIFYKGILLYMSSKYEEAIEAFEQCLEIGESNMKHLTQNGLGSFHAWHYKGLCKEKLGDPKEAEHCYNQALALHPGHIDSLEALRELGNQEHTG